MVKCSYCMVCRYCMVKCWDCLEICRDYMVKCRDYLLNLAETETVNYIERQRTLRLIIHWTRRGSL